MMSLGGTHTGAGRASRFVGDGWYFGNGRAAAVLPPAHWLAGEERDGSK